MDPLPSAPITLFEERFAIFENDEFALVEISSGKTIKIKAKYVTLAQPSTNYKWVSTFDYPLDAIVEYQGKWYLSLQTPNLGKIPSSPANAAFWEEQAKSASGFVFWQAGVFTGQDVFVIKLVNGSYELYFLSNPTRPFLSTDFDAELVAGDWVLMSGNSLTREPSRSFNGTLISDKNEIFYNIYVQTGPLVIEKGAGLVNQSSSHRLTIISNGIDPISFGASFQFDGTDFIFGIINGEILPAGVYRMFALYHNGQMDINIPRTTAGESAIVQLAVPANFAAVPNGENQIDLTWDDVANESNFRIEWSPNGVDTWTLLSSPAAGVVAESDAGLDPGETVFYRIKAIGDGTNFSDSAWSSVVSATTEDAGDVTPPTFIFSPADAAIDVSVNQPVTIDASEFIRDADGVTEIDNTNAADYITAKEDNSGGADIPVTVTYDPVLRRFTIPPNPSWGNNQDVYIAIDGVADGATPPNVAALASIIFTSSDYTTFFDGSSNMLLFGNGFNSFFSLPNAKFKIFITVKSPAITGNHMLFAIYSKNDNQRLIYWSINDQDLEVTYFPFVGDNTRYRRIRALGVVSDNNTDQAFELHYDGSIDTNNGEDRILMRKNGIDLASSLWGVQAGSLHDNLATSTAQVAVGQSANAAGDPTTTSYFLGLAKDLIVLSGPTDVVELNVPELRTGIDISGNNRHGTWV